MGEAKAWRPLRFKIVDPAWPGAPTSASQTTPARVIFALLAGWNDQAASFRELAEIP